MRRDHKQLGIPLPQVIANPPTLRHGLAFYINGFDNLTTERDAGNLQNIPWSKIINYAEYYELGDFENEQLIYFVQYIDTVYIEYIAKRRKTA